MWQFIILSSSLICRCVLDKETAVLTAALMVIIAPPTIIATPPVDIAAPPTAATTDAPVTNWPATLFDTEENARPALATFFPVVFP